VAVLAHPDDESRIMGGTLALHARRGWLVGLYCATRGEAGDPAMDPADVATLREAELEAACRTLGVSQVRLGRLADGGVATADPDAVIEDIVRYLRMVRPDVVVTFGPDGRDGHPDHVAIGRMAVEAFDQSGRADRHPHHRLLGLDPWLPGRLYETAMPASAAERFGWPHPTVADDELVRIDAREVFDRKRRAVVDDHASQWRLSPWNLSSAGWKAREIEHFRLAQGAVTDATGDNLL
jgi:LmbE family N-acetylglucosaminyl deacetylase